jgi:hypothetical protein
MDQKSSIIPEEQSFISVGVNLENSVCKHEKAANTRFAA